MALKTLWPQYVADEKVRRRFEREARSAARIESPFVVRVFGIDEHDGIPFIAMEFIRGGPILTRDGSPSFEWRRAAEIVRDVADCLSVAHDQGIIHRDVKPSNVMMGPDGRAKLADFGLARAIADESILATTTGTLLGTPAYLAPEVIEGIAASPLSDIYSLGVLLFRLVAGRLPFEGETAAAVLRGHLDGRFPRISTIVPDVPETIEAVIRGCAARDPNARYSDAARVKEDLERCLLGEMIIGPPAREETIGVDIPFWARFIPSAERTLKELKIGIAEAEQRSAETERLLRDAEQIEKILDTQIEEAEKNAAGWKTVAEKALEEGRESEACEALEYAHQHNAHAASYKAELEKTRASIRSQRTALIGAQAKAREAAIRGKILVNRRDQALFMLEVSARSPRVWLSLAIVAALLGAWGFWRNDAVTPPANKPVPSLLPSTITNIDTESDPTKLINGRVISGLPHDVEILTAIDFDLRAALAQIGESRSYAFNVVKSAQQSLNDRQNDIVGRLLISHQGDVSPPLSILSFAPVDWGNGSQLRLECEFIGKLKWATEAFNNHRGGVTSLSGVTAFFPKYDCPLVSTNRIRLIFSEITHSDEKPKLSISPSVDMPQPTIDTSDSFWISGRDLVAHDFPAKYQTPIYILMNGKVYSIILKLESWDVDRTDYSIGRIEGMLYLYRREDLLRHRLL